MKYEDFDKHFEEWKKQQLDIPTMLLMKIYEEVKANSKVMQVQTVDDIIIPKDKWNTQKSQKTSKKSSGRNS